MNDVLNFFGEWIDQMEPIQKGLWLGAFAFIGLVGGSMIASDLKKDALARARTTRAAADKIAGRRRFKNEITGEYVYF